MLYQDNEKKLIIIKQLEVCINKITQSSLDDSSKQDVVNSMNDVCILIKNSYELNKTHIKKVNPSANQTQEACERINKKKKTQVWM